MSERTRGSQIPGAQQEVHDLTDLHASKTQESLRHSVTEPANTDLASVSIQSISVVRLSTRPEKRKVTGLTVPTNPELDPTSEKQERQGANPTRGQRHGILRNPYFPYEGGPVERLITLLANVLKHLERSLLASLRPAPPQAPPQTTFIKTKKRDALGREIEEDSEAAQQVEKPLRIPTREST